MVIDRIELVFDCIFISTIQKICCLVLGIILNKMGGDKYANCYL